MSAVLSRLRRSHMLLEAGGDEGARRGNEGLDDDEAVLAQDGHGDAAPLAVQGSRMVGGRGWQQRARPACVRQRAWASERRAGQGGGGRGPRRAAPDPTFRPRASGGLPARTDQPAPRALAAHAQRTLRPRARASSSGGGQERNPLPSSPSKPRQARLQISPGEPGKANLARCMRLSRASEQPRTSLAPCSLPPRERRSSLSLLDLDSFSQRAARTESARKAETGSARARAEKVFEIAIAAMRASG